ncbi:MAG: glycosyltransferase family 2 protein [Chlorobiaceae bacterium]|nr:glycosyltransferase family 2 protein [Chlorobiaceae bacterium]
MHDSPASPPPVTVVIPHLKNRPMLDRCLDSLYAAGGTVPRVIVVDNGAQESDTDGLETARPGVEVLRLPANAGYAGGCNAGLQRCATRYVVFMNDDAEVGTGWLEPLVAEADRDPAIGALQPKILSSKAKREGRREFDYAGGAGGMLDRLGYPYCLGRSFSGTEEDRGQYDEPAEIFWASGVAMFARREAVERLGGFEEGFFMHMEEIDLCWRMRLQGLRIRSVPSSVVWHEGGASLRQGSAGKVYYNHRNAISMLFRNRGTAALCLIVPVRAMLELAAILYYLASGREGIPRAWQAVRAASDSVRGFGETLRMRSVIQRGRMVSDRELFRGAALSVFL